MATFSEAVFVRACKGEVGQFVPDLTDEVFTGEHLFLIFVHHFIPRPVDPNFPFIAPFGGSAGAHVVELVGGYHKLVLWASRIAGR